MKIPMIPMPRRNAVGRLVRTALVAVTLAGTGLVLVGCGDGYVFSNDPTPPPPPPPPVTPPPVTPPPVIPPPTTGGSGSGSSGVR